MDLKVGFEHHPCGGCGVATVLLVNGQPWHWGNMYGTCKTLPREWNRPRFLNDLERTHAPLRRVNGTMRKPYWRPDMPGITEQIVVPGWAWQRPFQGNATVLDRSGAWISAAASVDVAHGELAHTGEIEFAGAPGYYKVNVYPWLEENVPSPLGASLEGQDTVWLPAPRVVLLTELAREGRWADASIIDSYTCPAKARLTKWIDHVKAVRTDALQTYGRDSAEYDQVKIAFSQAVALMVGTPEPGQGRKWRCGVHRPDWAFAIQDLSAVTLWRWADRCRKVAPGEPPVALRNVDELVIPTAALEALTTVGERPLEIDPTGIKLGTFKVKNTEERL